MQQEANAASRELQVFINELNNDRSVYEILNAIKCDESLFGSLNEEEQQIVNTSLLEIKLSTSVNIEDDDTRAHIQRIKENIIYKEDEFYRLCHDVQENEMEIEHDTSG
eukprot:CAMPEP_0202696392 /NCGR_PEP_ID=MMETSP1385-20130828/9683_1 /ASSEMBLY_ACC=CAM_ASM_000861 /TAXON_ID=933848 /ORGANISM="Elphidium margaritaceum" /LENGTH=108 /DNA_ID=CAMNT_0049352549 /DNA_START=122 /DNA_END=444 /DNA_ORIENTATION=-